ncbi:MAG: hypothetical protein AAB412_00825 [Elusimicrobiota bacterium]
MIQVLAAAALLLGSARAADAPAWMSYSPPSRAFSCEIRAWGWSTWEERSVRGISAHLLGPKAAGPIRPAYHIHHFEKNTPGYAPIEQTLRRAREKDPASRRESTSLVSWRVSRKASKVFEVREWRLFPADTLPAMEVPLHHFYAFVPVSESDYFIIKLTVSEEDLHDFRPEFRRFLESFHIFGY